MPAYSVIGVDFFVAGAVLFNYEDGVADGEGIVEGLRTGRGGRRGGGGGLRGGGRGWAGGEDGGAGGWKEGNFVGRVIGGGHFRDVCWRLLVGW